MIRVLGPIVPGDSFVTVWADSNEGGLRRRDRRRAFRFLVLFFAFFGRFGLGGVGGLFFGPGGLGRLRSIHASAASIAVTMPILATARTIGEMVRLGCS